MSVEEKIDGWYTHESVLFYIPKIKDFFHGYDDTLEEKNPNPLKMAAFDLDGTLISSSNGKKYSIEASDWVFAYDNVISKLRELKDDGYFICIISNRKAEIGSNIVKKSQKRIENVFKLLKFKCFAFLLTGKDKYRKPETGVLTMILTLLNSTSFSSSSFYCGDAAKGVSSNSWEQWNNTDYMLVKNYNTQFKTDLKFFPASSYFRGSETDFDHFSDLFPNIDDINLVITCGQIGSGYKQLINFDDGFDIYTDMDYHNSDSERIVVIGSNPTIQSRDNIRQKLGFTKSETLIVWYSKPSLEKLTAMQLRNYSKTFQHPSKFDIQYVRGN